MLRNFLLVLCLLVTQTIIFACPSYSIYTSNKVYKAPIHAKSTDRFFEHLSGDKIRTMVFGKSRLLIKSGLHSYSDLTQHLFKAHHLKYMLNNRFEVKSQYIEYLDNEMLLVYLPEEAYIYNALERVKKKSEIPVHYDDYVLTKIIDGKVYYGHNVFPKSFSKRDIINSSLETLKDPRTIFKTYSSGRVRARGYFKDSRGNEIPTFIILNDNLQIITAYPDYNSTINNF